MVEHYTSNQIKNKTYHTVGRVPTYNRNIVERGKIDTPKNT